MGITERRQREKEQRSQDIIDAAEKVFFSKGYEKATMDEVAEEAELSKGTLYLYFKTKEDLYLAIALRGNAILRHLALQAIQDKQTGLDKIIAMTEAYFDFYNRYRNYFDAMHHLDTTELTQEQMQQRHEAFQRSEGALLLLSDIVAEGIKDGSIRPDINPQKQALLIWGQSLGVVQILIYKGCLIEESNLSFETLMEAYFITLRHSLAA